jgi:hypothetical protein
MIKTGTWNILFCLEKKERGFFSRLFTPGKKVVMKANVYTNGSNTPTYVLERMLCSTDQNFLEILMNDAKSRLSAIPSAWKEVFQFPDGWSLTSDHSPARRLDIFHELTKL